MRIPESFQSCQNTENSICHPLATLVNFMHDLFYYKTVAAFAANRLAVFLKALPAFRLWSQSQTMCFLPAVLGLRSFSGAQQNAALRPASCIANV
ncbi:hypothetical protein [Ottowia sp. oral taxon 894]|uniref:hypothetical protein n=1 Tax=Ottowia sp. oral taxon 894 TaxID=1658672 RepID=UPI00155DC30F|nr:hypothetical protein [Ottowia sp. oral taxon 894]